jgi:hypothetical protein
MTLDDAMAAFGAAVKAKLANPATRGQPEEQLRAPFEQLLADLAVLCLQPAGTVTAVGESSISDLKTRPDYSITVRRTLVGFIELKAPGKGADPRRFRDQHDRQQWERLKALPNLIYTDGQSFSLWRDGELSGQIVQCHGDLDTAGKAFAAPPELLNLFERFFLWQPIPPRNAKELAVISARLCRLLRDEVSEQMALGSKALTELAEDWRKLLFPDANDKRFADGYAQAVTFGLLMARANGIQLSEGFEQVARDLSHASTLIGAALRLLTDNADNQATLKTSLGSLSRVLDAVDWATISKGNPEAWLYFYEDFLEEYDNELRKLTGSYYTPVEVVEAMVQLVDELLTSPAFRQPAGLASPSVTLVDPATGTGTYMLGVLRKIADTVSRDQGEGAVAQAINAALKRLIAFEMQLGPFAVAQLRLLAEVLAITGVPPKEPLRMFVTDTLSNPEDDQGWIPGMLAPIAESRKQANRIKREETITVVIGNPPYKEKAKGRGGWIEGEDADTDEASPLSAWFPPKEWGVGAHAKHLRNLYVYFWRWATWKVFDRQPDNASGVVSFITVAGFLNGPGFQAMRAYLRKTCDQIWVIDCSPEGHQPAVNTRIFQGVQQPVCIVMASRGSRAKHAAAAEVKYRALSEGNRNEKLGALKNLRLASSDWLECPRDERAPFLPNSAGAWAAFPYLDDLFIYNGAGVQPKRVWVIAPDAQSLKERWHQLIHAPLEAKQALFHPTLRNGVPADRHIDSVVRQGLAGFGANLTPLAREARPCNEPLMYGFRFFNRQWIIPDARVITQPNAALWTSWSQNQVYLTAPMDRSPSEKPSIAFTCCIPDLHHYNSRGGRVFPLWSNAEATVPNITPGLIFYLAETLSHHILPEDVMAYIAAVAAHPGFTARFQEDLSTPGLRIPLTADPELFAEAVALGRRVIWLHSFGERMADPSQGRPAQPPRLDDARRPTIPKDGAIPDDPEHMPDAIHYDSGSRRLHIGAGFVERVEPAVWNYNVSGKQVILHWFSYRKKNRDRPLIGDRRPPSLLAFIQPDHWLAEYTSELINLLNILQLLVDLEPQQHDLLTRIGKAKLISRAELQSAGALASSQRGTGSASDRSSEQTSLF